MKLNYLTNLLITSTLLAGCSQAPNINSDLNRDPWKTKLEQRVNRHDAWVRNTIKNNYTEENNKPVSLQFISEESELRLRDKGLHGVHGIYSFDTNLASFPKIDENVDRVTEAIDHEIWHTFEDSIGVKGVFYHESFKGPAPERIAEHALRSMQDPIYDEVRTFVTDQLDLLRFGEIARQLNHNLENTGIAIQSLEVLKDYLEGYRANDFLDEEKAKELEVEQTKIGLEVNRYVDLASKIMSWKNEKVEDIKDVQLTSDQAREMEKELSRFLEEAEKYDDLVGRINEYVNDCYAILDKGEDEKFAAQMAELEDLKSSSTDKELSNYYQNRIEIVREAYESNVLFRNFRGFTSTASLSSSVDQATHAANFSVNYERMQKTIFNPSEIMARKYTALVNLHFEEPDMQYYTPTQEDLDFLWTFEINGEKMFRKVLQKYEIGKALFDSGVPKEQVRDVLLDANSITIDGVFYDWKSSIPRWEIIGDIPVSSYADLADKIDISKK